MDQARSHQLPPTGLSAYSTIFPFLSELSLGQRLQELKRELEQRQKELTSKKNQTKEYDRLAQQLDLPPYTDNTTFYAARTKGEELKQDIGAAMQTLEAQRDEKIALRSDLQKQQTKLEDELKSLRSRKSQIPKNNLDIRDRLVRDLNLAQTDLPFIGELLQVRLEAQEWEGAIERLLRGFGLCVLVSDAHYQGVLCKTRGTSDGCGTQLSVQLEKCWHMF